VAGVCLLLVAGPAPAQDKDNGTSKKEIAWAKSYDAALKEAGKGKKLIMVDFYTDWCGWCKKLDADTYTDPKVIKEADKLVALKLDAEDKGVGEKLAKKYGVQGFPTILFLDPAGIEQDDKADNDVAGKIVGYMPGGPFAAEMKKIGEAFRDFPEMKKAYDSGKADLKTLGRLAVISHQRGDNATAEKVLKEGEEKDPKNEKGFLTKAYNAVADAYQEKGQFDKAIPLFDKAAQTGKEPGDIAYARMSIAVCNAQQGKLSEAARQLEKSLKIEGISKEDREQAEALLKQIKQAAKNNGDDGEAK
jgi:thiol-disulfide isomerase/thioredoxin